MGTTKNDFRASPKFYFFIRILNKLNEKLALSTTQEYLDTHFKNSNLKSILVSQWGDYGLPPKKVLFLIHSTIATHYLKVLYTRKEEQDPSQRLQNLSSSQMEANAY